MSLIGSQNTRHSGSNAVLFQYRIPRSSSQTAFWRFLIQVIYGAFSGKVINKKPSVYEALASAEGWLLDYAMVWRLLLCADLFQKAFFVQFVKDAVIDHVLGL